MTTEIGTGNDVLRPLEDDGQRMVADFERMSIALGEWLPPDRQERTRVVSQLAPQQFAGLIALTHQLVVPESGPCPVPWAQSVETRDGTYRERLATPEQRWPILVTATQITAQMAQDIPAFHEREYLERAANIAGLAIVLAHPFADGNGRTARILGRVIEHGASSPQALKYLGTNRELQVPRSPTYAPRKLVRDARDFLHQAAVWHVPLQDQFSYMLRSGELFFSPSQVNLPTYIDRD